MAASTAETNRLFDADVSQWMTDILTAVADDLVASSPSLSHHTGITAEEEGHRTDLILAHAGTVTVPGFDMKYEGYPVGPEGQMRGHLLVGPATRTSKKGVRYNVIPLDPSVEPGPYHRSQEDNPELFVSANMLAAKAGVQAAVSFLQGAGAAQDAIYKWVTERYGGAKPQGGGRSVVFRTVTDQPNQAAAWWYPPRQEADPASLAQAMADVEAWLAGGGG